MADFVKVAKIEDIPPGEGRPFEVNDREIAVFNCNGEFYAIDNVCPHHYGPLGEGGLMGKVVACPWHGWQFDVATGESPMIPNERVDKFDVKVEGDDILVAVEE